MENVVGITLHAARLGETAVLTELIDRGVDVNVQDEKGYTPLIIACYNNRYDAAALLLRHGADVNTADFGGNTALMGAAFKGYADIARLLLMHGADLDRQQAHSAVSSPEPPPPQLIA